MNILSFDVEDWYQLANRRITGALTPARDTIFRQVDALLAVLAETDSKATFFVLGLVAERYPELVRELAGAGHEIASHGYAHVVLSRLTQAEFEQDVAKSKNLLEQITGVEVSGYRAPEFSIGCKTAWALDSLAKLGFAYDSSIFPIRHPRYGIPHFDPRPGTYTTANGDISELPLSAVQIGGAKLPVAGGGYFRVLPLDVLRRSVEWLGHRGLPFVTYFHPYEFDPDYLDILQTVMPVSAAQHLRCRKLNLRYRIGHRAIKRKLAALLKEFPFRTCKEYLNAVEPTKGRTILRPISVAI